MRLDLSTIPNGQIIYEPTLGVPAIECGSNLYGLDGRLITPSISRQLWGWGNGRSLGSNNSFATSPTRECCNSTNWCSVAVSSTATYALKTDGGLWTTGNENAGQLGNGISGYGLKFTFIREFCSSNDWTRVSGSAGTGMAVKTNGTLWGWGSNGGKLGNGNTATSCSPIQEFCSATDWSRVSIGQDHSTAIKTDGSLWAWGLNACGQLGIGNVLTRCSPVREICSATNWCQVSAGQCYTLAIKTDGSLWGWGHSGPLATSTGTICSPAREICSATNWCCVASGGGSVAAIKTNGTLWTWGCNCCGQLGTGNLTDRITPVQEICSATNWCTASTVNDPYLCNVAVHAIKTDGTLWGWGYNGCGLLGNSVYTACSRPVRESSSASDWVCVVTGSDHAHAIKYVYSVNR